MRCNMPTTKASCIATSNPKTYCSIGGPSWKIADFGLARLLGQLPEDPVADRDAPSHGHSPLHVPEQMEGSSDVDHRADIYSLGVVFYEMLTRELPLGHFPPPSRKVQVDVRLDDVVLRTLEKEPRRRYQHASELKKDVETISGMAPVRWQNCALYGREYRSERQLFGWPLVHIANGIDPVTGRRRVAKGIIAIGDTAIGGLLAIGGTAIGPIAMGGAAFGLFTIGGLSVGLLGAWGWPSEWVFRVAEQLSRDHCGRRGRRWHLRLWWWSIRSPYVQRSLA